MTTFDRYIVRRILVGFGTLLGLLIVFFITLHYVEYSDDFFDCGATFGEVFGTYYPSYIPEIIRLTSPLALFLAAILMTARLAQELQLAALMTSGVSLYRLAVPYLFIGVVVTLGMWWFNGWVVPTTNQTRVDYEYRCFRGENRRVKTSNIYLQNSPTSILVVNDYFDRRTDTAHRISLQEFADGNKVVERIDAQEMRWIDSTDSWHLEDVVWRRFLPDGTETRSFFVRLDTTLNVLPRDLRRRDRDVEFLTISESRAFIQALRRSGAGGIGRPLVEYYSKYTYPLANFILIMIGLPLAAVRRRGGQAIQLGLGLAIAFAYLAFLKLAEPFGYAGDISPMAASVLPHAVFLIVAVALLVKART